MPKTTRFAVKSMARILAMDTLKREAGITDFDDGLAIIDGFASILERGLTLSPNTKDQWVLYATTLRKIFDILEKGTEEIPARQTGCARYCPCRYHTQPHPPDAA